MTKRLAHYEKALANCWKQFEVVNARRAKVVARLKKEQELTDKEKIDSLRHHKPDWPWLLKVSGQSTFKWQERKDCLADLSGLTEFQFGSFGAWNDTDQAGIEIGLKKNDPVRTELIYQAIQTLLPFILPLKDGFKTFYIKKGNNDSGDMCTLCIRPEDGHAKIMKNTYSLYRDFQPLMEALTFCQQAIYFDSDKEEED